jgi:hypothetical protein
MPLDSILILLDYSMNYGHAHKNATSCTETIMKCAQSMINNSHNIEY